MKIFLSQWERALAEGRETIVMGVMNLDWSTCMEDDLQVGTPAYKLKPLVDEFKLKIMPLGVVQGTTRSWPGQADSCLDLVFTNAPEKMS